MSISCEDMGIRVMALTDGELGVEEVREVKGHIETCEHCKDKYQSLTQLKNILGEMEMKKLPEMYWDEYWTHIYNRMERGIAWILFSLGSIIIGIFVFWQMISGLLEDKVMHPLMKAGIFLLLAGTVILIVSVVREKFMIKKVDKYREVER